MLSHRVSFFLGLWLLLMPVVGIPSSWKFFLEIVVGITLVTVSGLSIKKETVSRFIHRRERGSELFVENKEKQGVGNSSQTL